MNDAQAASPRSPSRPRAPWWAIALVYIALLAVACAAIWWIDRGAMMNNAPVGKQDKQD